MVEMMQMFYVTSSKVCLCALGRSCFQLLWHPPIFMERTTPLVIDQVKLDVLSANQHHPKIIGCSCHNKLDMAEKFENFELFCLMFLVVNIF